MTLSLCIIAKNEAKNLTKCIESFSGLFDELIVVDTGSTDETKEIAKSLNAKVFDFEWIDDFSAARNFALSMANSEFLMMVDCDDRIDFFEKEKLINSIKNLSPRVDGVFLPYRISSIHEGKTVEKESVFLKIWRKKLAFKYVDRIHEYLNFESTENLSFIQLDTPIFTVGEFSEHFERNLKILEKAHNENPNNTRYLYFLGHDNQFSGNLREAIAWYEKYLLLNSVNSDELNRVFFYKGICHLKLSEIEIACDCFEQAIVANPSFIEPYIVLGDVAIKRGDFDFASYNYLKASELEIPKTHIFVDKSLYNGLAKKRYLNSILKKKNAKNHSPLF